ncbi:transposase [Methylosinus sp. Sm6]|uniref:IS66 family transposase n=1 Tax=Methylosinus sp. Sm6 TaxID=2866948 RepID=UPI001C996ECD|nr:transposase [Methylosinus sp. Sm6]MBY6243609.1 transposase [Methylosinus sp. Sm6]
MIKRTRRLLFVFLTNRDLPATNNGSERAIRPCVIFRKVTYCFRSGWGAELYADIRSGIETGRRRAIDALAAIRLTLAGKPLATPAPSRAPAASRNLSRPHKIDRSDAGLPPPHSTTADRG